jgi:hypothetical protein
MTGNPAMGFASERGMFVSTSFELFGTNPKLSESEKSSFASLLLHPTARLVSRWNPLHPKRT